MTSSRKTTSDAPSRSASRRWWTAGGLLAVGCLAAGAWAIPQASANWPLLTGADQAEPLTAATSSPDPVITLDPDAPTPSAQEVAQGLQRAAQGFSGGSLTAQVADASTGAVLYSDDAATPVMPASNLKILTAYALLTHQDPQDRYATTGHLGQDGKSVVLQAGGDTLLSPEEASPEETVGHAGLADLARQTVASLQERGVSGAVPVALDQSRFQGSRLSSYWAPEDVQTGYVTQVHPIALWDHHTQRPTDGEDTSHRSQDAGAEALTAYVTALNAAGRAAGLTFSAGGTDATTAEGAASLGRVESATVLDQARYMLEESDNQLAEVLGRNAAVAAGQEGSEEGGIGLVRQTLQEAGISTDGLDQADLCGLSADNRVTPITLVGAMRSATQAQDARAQLVSALPVAGSTGTLAQRFDDADEAAAAGWARAKTGTLLKVASLTGVTTTAQGRLVVYSFIINDVKDLQASKDVLDRSVAALTAA